MVAGADRHLLFGLLALQNGLIEPAQLVAAFHAWTRDKGRPLADHLEALGHLDAEDRAVVEAMAARYLQRHGGDPEQSLGAIPAGCPVRAELAGLGDPQLDATLARIRSGSAATQEAEGGRTVSYAVGAATSAGQRFRVLRPHARGGLGAVFVALDSELNREVALKQILDGLADDPATRARFLLEAEITGRLEHPSIVPVYGLGTHPDGRPYYAMRFVRGDSLKEAIEAFHADEALRSDPGRRSLELRKLLRRFLDVCNAIDYAHSRGILHRDLKPANVILGKHGETFVVDWGLAKPVGPPEPGASRDERTLLPALTGGSAETLPGAALGTPAYMSPEQARGELDALGPRSDVYSLGATLYFLLTGRAPFEGPDVGSILRAVQKGKFAPPRRVERRNDAALDAICVKAMEHDPRDRYPSARALAEDLDRWLADEPVSAHREPWRTRLARWERRNKPWVYGGVAALVMAVVGLGASWVALSREKAATEQALSKAEVSADISRIHFTRAAEVAFRLISETADQRLNRVPGLEGMRKEMVQQAVSEIKYFMDSLPKDPKILRLAERTYRNAAVVYWLIGEFDEAKRAYDSAIAHAETLARMASSGEAPERLKRAHSTADRHVFSEAVEDRLRLADALRQMATFLHESGHDGEAAPYFERARTQYEGLLVGLGDAYPFTQGQVHKAIGWFAVRAGEAALDDGDGPAARASYARAIEQLSPIARKPNEWYWYRLFIAQAHLGLGRIAREEGEPAVAGRELIEAVRIAREVVKDHDELDAKSELANSLTHLGGHLASVPGREGDAEATLDEAVAILDRLTAESPGTTWFRCDRAEALLARAARHAAARRDARAEADLTEARRLARDLAAKTPRDRSYPGLLGRSELALAGVRRHQGRTGEATGLLNEAIAHLEQSRRDRPGNRITLRALADARAARDASRTLRAAAGASPADR